MTQPVWIPQKGLALTFTWSNESYVWVSKFWRYVLGCWGLWLCDSSDKMGSQEFNMAGMWPGIAEKLLKWRKKTKENILFYSKFFLTTFLWKGKFLDITSSAPKTVIGVTKVANYIYLPYLQLCRKASMWIFMYCRCKSDPKLR